MSSGTLLIAALALLCTAGALLLWQRGARRDERASTERFIDSRMAPAVPSAAGGARGVPLRPQAPAHGGVAPHAPAAGADGRVQWAYLKAQVGFLIDNTMSRAGISHARVPMIAVAVVSLWLCLWAAREGGWLAAAVTLLACLCFVAFIVSVRTQKRRLEIVRHLPSFLDGIVRLITLGNSVPAAFQGAMQITEGPLRECLDYVSRMLRTGVEIDRALSQAAVLYGARELELVGAVLRLSVKYGGRADVMLDRMSSFMRDLEQAERELSAMSAETRLSAWILALMPVGIGGFLMLTNPRYFGAMWFDPSGRELVYLAFGLQIGGAFLLYRLTRLRGG
ncbi:type II secretion system F family protein [Paraburkholderia phenazinium]|uniref:Tight adherence protein B n=1 Tax=Paraburkholderia phenazinium TaxID=60549 RepID=A0A1G8ELD0_9BURK|nr:type II secretion system F family protein [Paraburkholderia phenazinium]SDH70705.1 tight adherence protein B [Paraburkholderia phenazinium]